MKYSLFLAFVTLVTSVSAKCDGTPDVTWEHMNSCSYPNDEDCDRRCKAAGRGCGGCGGFGWEQC